MLCAVGVISRTHSRLCFFCESCNWYLSRRRGETRNHWFVSYYLIVHHSIGSPRSFSLTYWNEGPELNTNHNTFMGKDKHNRCFLQIKVVKCNNIRIEKSQIMYTFSFLIFANFRILNILQMHEHNQLMNAVKAISRLETRSMCNVF